MTEVHLMWQWPSGEILSWERSFPSRESARAASTIFPFLGNMVRRTILALPLKGIICAAEGPVLGEPVPCKRYRDVAKPAKRLTSWLWMLPISSAVKVYAIGCMLCKLSLLCCHHLQSEMPMAIDSVL